MNKIITIILACLFFSLTGIVTLSEAQTMKDEGLTDRQKSIVPIASFTASGDMQKLKTALNEGLDAGLTVNEIKEILDRSLGRRSAGRDTGDHVGRRTRQRTPRTAQSRPSSSSAGHRAGHG